MKVVLVLMRNGKRRDFPVEKDAVTLGRGQDCDLRIPTRDVSRRHCEIVREDDDLMVTDLGSANGTYVNGKRVAETVLSAGDRLRIGPATFVVQINGQPAKITVPVAEGSGAPVAEPAGSAPSGVGTPPAPAKPAQAKPAAAAPAAAASGDEIELDLDDLFDDLDDSDIDLDEPLTEINEVRPTPTSSKGKPKA